MANLQKNYGDLTDYVAWRGDIPLSQVPWNTLDSLLLAVICYQDFDLPRAMSLEEVARAGLQPKRDVSAEHKRVALIHQMAAQPRYAYLILHKQISLLSADQSLQFSALACLSPDPSGPVIIAYRGTDHTLVGWKEDFMMSYASPVPAQSQALTFLEEVAEATGNRPLVLTGHSKGGNLASYAAAHASDTIRARILEVASFDGPGLDDDTMESKGYAEIRPRLHSVIPNGSVVGLLMNYHPDYTVVQSTTVGLFQHDPLSWEIMGGRFIEAPETTRSSQLMNETVHTWLGKCTQEEVQDFVETLFTALEKLYPQRGEEDLFEIRPASLVDAGAYILSLDSAMRERILSLLQSLLTTGREAYRQIMVEKPLQGALEDLSSLLGKGQDTTKGDKA
ncbi:MAG: DUF2974 domain-containing protein [Clostridia bacterium]|nr:DUF2974 domain-containing protein [Clostridia bacterium]